jgi:enoyl-CoA hydratase
LFNIVFACSRLLVGMVFLDVIHMKAVSHRADLDEGLQAEQAAFADVFRTEDAREGIGAFLDKREATWRGR